MEEQQNFNHNLFASNLKEAMKAKGFSKYRLAKLTKAQTSKVSDWIDEKGNNPRIDTLFAICKALGVDSDYLIGLSDEPNKLTTNISKITGLTAKSIENIRRQPKKTIDYINIMLSDNNILAKIIEIIDYICSEPFEYNQQYDLTAEDIERARISRITCWLYNLKMGMWRQSNGEKD